MLLVVHICYFTVYGKFAFCAYVFLQFRNLNVLKLHVFFFLFINVELLLIFVWSLLSSGPSVIELQIQPNLTQPITKSDSRMNFFVRFLYIIQFMVPSQIVYVPVVNQQKCVFINRNGVCICVIESAHVFLQFLVNLMHSLHMCFYSF